MCVRLYIVTVAYIFTCYRIFIIASSNIIHINSIYTCARVPLPYIIFIYIILYYNILYNNICAIKKKIMQIPARRKYLSNQIHFSQIWITREIGDDKIKTSSQSSVL